MPYEFMTIPSDDAHISVILLSIYVRRTYVVLPCGFMTAPMRSDFYSSLMCWVTLGN